MCITGLGDAKVRPAGGPRRGTAGLKGGTDAARVMSRRRPSFPTYAARRWRALGLLGVLLAGSLLVLGIMDRGHEPLWVVRTGDVDAAALAPDASVVYALIREGGNLTRLEARAGEGGSLLWESPMHAPRALLAAGSEGVAVATDFPFAFLTVYGRDGSVRSSVPLEGNPRAMVMEGDRLALALQAPGNPLLVFDAGRLARTHSFAGFVTALDLRAGRLAAGTGGGEVVLFDSDGARAFNASLAMGVRTLHLGADGTSLVVGGSGLGAGGLSGAVAFVDVTQPEPLRWTQSTKVGVRLVALDEAGLWALAVEETPLNHTVRLFEAATGQPRWSHAAEGYVSRDDSGGVVGADLSPDGRFVVVGTLRGDLVVLRVSDGSQRWRFDAEGLTQAAFARDAPDRILATGRLVPAGPYSTVLLFSVQQEPFGGRLPVLALLAAASAALGAALLLGVGYWRVRRSY